MNGSLTPQGKSDFLHKLNDDIINIYFTSVSRIFVLNTAVEKPLVTWQAKGQLLNLFKLLFSFFNSLSVHLTLLCPDII